ncbi:hypothetical protein DAI22_01g197300 [Oryza sativa Japonica Group]|nr:hypothetical protein DAI22_01g197300 [Oryza sativa Japonica Group]
MHVFSRSTRRMIIIWSAGLLHACYLTTNSCRGISVDFDLTHTTVGGLTRARIR